MIPSYFRIKILAIRDEFVTQGHKGLRPEYIGIDYFIVKRLLNSIPMLFIYILVFI